MISCRRTLDSDDLLFVIIWALRSSLIDNDLAAQMCWPGMTFRSSIRLVSVGLLSSSSRLT